MKNIHSIRHMKIKFLHLIRLESFVRKDDKLCLSAEFPEVCWPTVIRVAPKCTVLNWQTIMTRRLSGGKRGGQM